MIRTGDTVENPITGESITFLRTSADTGGEYVLIDVTVQPDGAVAAKHVHPYQSERFEIISGELEMEAGRDRIVARAGDVVTIKPGTAHTFRTLGDVPAHFRCEVRPALSFERFIETMFGLAADGKTNRKGMPNPFRLAVIMNSHFDLVRLPFPPAFMQKTGLAMGAPMGRMLGYKPSYVPSQEAAPAAGLAL
jgi:quercetin dioxygenase-like cupin family protein